MGNFYFNYNIKKMRKATKRNKKNNKETTNKQLEIKKRNKRKFTL